MRRRITWLMVASTTGIVLAFVIPLCLLVRTLAEQRAMAACDQEARSAAILVSGLHDDPRLGDLVSVVDARTPARTSVVTPHGAVLGDRTDQLAGDPEVRRARSGEAFSVLDGRGGRVYVPVVVEDGLFIVRTAVAEPELHRGVAEAWAAVIGLGVLLCLVASVFAARMGARISRPVAAVAEVAYRLHEGDLSARAQPDGPPETVELAQALNALAGRIADLLASERAGVADLAHRLRTPLTALRLNLEGAGLGTDERVMADLAAVQRSVDTIVREARRPVREDLAVECDAAAAIAEALSFWSALAEDQGRQVDVAVPRSSVMVGLSAVDLRDVLDICLDNVFAHTPEGTPFSVRLATESSTVQVEVADAGPGFGAVADRIGSTGLGLDIVRRTLARVGGKLESSEVGDAGAWVRLILPLAAAGRDGSPATDGGAGTTWQAAADQPVRRG